MRSDHLARHMKQHSKKNENNPVTNISVTHNYNSRPGILTQISKEENGIKDEKSEIKKEELRKHLINVGNEYQRKLVLGNDIYEMMGEGIAPYQVLPREMKEAVDLYIENQADFRDVGNVELNPVF